MTERRPGGSCAEIRRMLPEAAESALPPAEARQVRAHVAGCAACAEALEAVADAWAVLPEARPVTPSSEARRRVLARARGWPDAPPRRGQAERSASWRRWPVAVGLVLLATAAGLGLNAVAREGRAPTAPETPAEAPAVPVRLSTGDPIPSFAAPDVNTGERVSLDDLRGEVVLLNLWATWCLPCESEMGSMERVHRELGPRGLRVVALSIDRESTHLVRRWVEERGLTFTVLHDARGDFERTFASAGVPETYVFDRDGSLVAHEVGPRRWDAPASSARLAELLAGGA